jgi:hypothetical protein
MESFFENLPTYVVSAVVLMILVGVPLAWLLQQVVDGLYGLCDFLTAIRDFIADTVYAYRTRRPKPGARKPKQPDTTFPTLPL